MQITYTTVIVFLACLAFYSLAFALAWARSAPLRHTLIAAAHRGHPWRRRVVGGSYIVMWASVAVVLAALFWEPTPSQVVKGGMLAFAAAGATYLIGAWSLLWSRVSRSRKRSDRVT
jgi:hypothetical protein